MSPRAACRLERLGFARVYDYVAGKADWLAAGLPTEGRTRPARVIDAMLRDPPTCAPDETVSAVAGRLRADGRSSCLVITSDRVVLGRFRLDGVDIDVDVAVEEVMEPGPTTVRADAGLDDTLARMRERHVGSLLVTTPDGVLLGEIRMTMEGGDTQD